MTSTCQYRSSSRRIAYDEIHITIKKYRIYRKLSSSQVLNKHELGELVETYNEAVRNIDYTTPSKSWNITSGRWDILREKSRGENLELSVFDGIFCIVHEYL